MSVVDPVVSAVLITSSVPDNNYFGTGFVIHQDEDGTYLLTCAHVVQDVGGPDEVVAGGNKASIVASGAEDGTDLAVLRTEGLRDKLPLPLNSKASRGQRFKTAGFQQYGWSTYLIRPLDGVLGHQVEIGRSQSSLAKAWDLKITDEYQLQPGYSGSPVVDEEGYVIAVVSTRQSEGTKGLAISVAALTKVWHDAPPNIISDNSGQASGLDIVSRRLTALSLFSPTPILGNLVGREQLIKSVARDVLARRCNAVAIQGIAGVGKTSVAIAVSESLGGAQWIDCAREEVTFEKFVLSVAALASEQGIADAATFVNLYQDVTSRMKAVIDILSAQRWTMVFDDFHLVSNEDLKRLLLEISEHCPGITLIFTSRVWLGFLETIKFRVQPRYVQLEGLALDAAVELMRQLGDSYPRLRSATTETLRQIWQQAANGHPIALRIFAMLTRQHPIAELLERTGNYQDELGKWIKELFDGLSADEVRAAQFLSIFRTPMTGIVLDSLLSQISDDSDSILSLGRPTSKFLVEHDSGDRLYLHPLLKDYAYRSCSAGLLRQYHKLAAEYYETCRAADADDLASGLEANYHYKRAGADELAARVVTKIKAGLFYTGQYEQLSELLRDIEPYTCRYIATDGIEREPVLFLGGGEVAHGMIKTLDPRRYSTIVIDRLSVATGDVDHQFLLGETVFRDTDRIVSILRDLSTAINAAKNSRLPMIFADYYGFDANHVYEVADSLGFRLMPNKAAALVAADKIAFWEYFRDVPEVRSSLIPRTWLAFPPMVAEQLRTDSTGSAVKDFVLQIATELRATGLPCVLKLANSELGYGQSIIRAADERVILDALKFAIEQSDKHGINPGDRLVLEREIEPEFDEVVMIAVRHVDPEGGPRTSFAPPVLVRHASEADLLRDHTSLVHGPFVLDLAIQCAVGQLPPPVQRYLPRMQLLAGEMVRALGDAPGVYGIGFFVTETGTWIGDDIPVKVEDTMFVTQVAQRQSAADMVLSCLNGTPIPARVVQELAFAGGVRTLLWRQMYSAELEHIEGRVKASAMPGIHEVLTYDSKVGLRPLRLMGVVLARLPREATRSQLEDRLSEALSELRIISRLHVISQHVIVQYG